MSSSTSKRSRQQLMLAPIHVSRENALCCLETVRRTDAHLGERLRETDVEQLVRSRDTRRCGLRRQGQLALTGGRRCLSGLLRGQALLLHLNDLRCDLLDGLEETLAVARDLDEV